MPHQLVLVLVASDFADSTAVLLLIFVVFALVLLGFCPVLLFLWLLVWWFSQ